MEPNRYGSNFLPRITDVEWKLEVLTNTPGVGSDNLLYNVVLKTDGEDVRFTCGTQQLQDLLYKLKDLEHLIAWWDDFVGKVVTNQGRHLPPDQTTDYFEIIKSKLPCRE